MKTFLFIFLSVLLVSCSVENKAIEGPKGTIWIGGEDGGAFVSIALSSKPNIYEATIYYQNGHDIWYQGSMKLAGQKTLVTKSRSSYLFWDGETLHLSDGGQLIPL